MLCRTEISYILGIIFKLIVSFLFVAVLLTGWVNAQDYDADNSGNIAENSGDIANNDIAENDDDIADNGDNIDDEPYFDPDDQPLVIPKGEMFEEGASIENVIEGVGTVLFAGTPVYTMPDRKSKVMRYAISGEKVTIMSNNDDWYYVRMYNGKEGFIEKRNIKTVKIFHDENVTLNQMNRRLNVELHALVNKFNKTLQESVYANKYQIIPRLTIINSAKRKNVITVMLEYSAVDINGKVIPSMLNNALASEMRYFIELFFMKMLTAGASEYQILIYKPIFSPTGQVYNIQKEYAELRIVHSDVLINELKRQRGKVLEMARCSMPMEKLFTDFPN